MDPPSSVDAQPYLDADREFMCTVPTTSLATLCGGAASTWQVARSDNCVVLVAAFVTMFSSPPVDECPVQPSSINRFKTLAIGRSHANQAWQ